MLKLLNIIQKRPSDFTIRTLRIVFGLIIILWVYYNLIYLGKWVDNKFFDFSLFGFVLSNWFVLSEEWTLIFKYCLMLLWAVPLFMWITNLCLFKKNIVRILQIIYAFCLFYLAAIMQSSATLDFDSLVWVMWLLPLFAWITWKCITSNCMKYKEKITKIRV